MFQFFGGRHGTLLALDAGSDQVRMYRAGRGLVLSEPSVLALRRPEPGGFPEVVGAGERARALLFKAPRTITAERPIRDGTIADPDLAALLFQAFFSQVLGRRSILRRKPLALAGVPAAATRLEKAAFFQSLYAAGAGRVYLVERLRAAGLELALSQPKATLVLDVGRDIAEAAVLSLGSILHSASVRSGSAALDRALISYVRTTYNLLIGETSAEALKKGYLSAVERDEVRTDIRGRDLITNLPRSIALSNRELSGAAAGVLDAWVALVTELLAALSPEVACDLMETGIILVGGGVLLDGAADFVRQRTGLPVRVADDPQGAVLRGLGRIVESFADYQQILEKG